jgi:hypothetical protein
LMASVTLPLMARSVRSCIRAARMYVSFASTTGGVLLSARRLLMRRLWLAPSGRTCREIVVPVARLGMQVIFYVRDYQTCRR